MININLVSQKEFGRIVQLNIHRDLKLKIIADMCRINTLAIVKRAGSGHLGSSLSAMDIVIKLYYDILNVTEVGILSPDRDIYFSSKGHDVPGFYAMLYSLGTLDQSKIMRLRRVCGLDGHPDINIPGVEANSGSLGMGISKAKGIAWAKQYNGYGGRVFVMTGDGELQEGQNFEALQSAAHLGISNLTVIVDHNKVQSDKPVAEIVSLCDLEKKFQSFGWHVARCNGNDLKDLDRVFSEVAQVAAKPKIIIADTIKGCGVSFMEHPQALKDGNGCYPYHSGAPSDEKYHNAYEEIFIRVNVALNELGIAPITCELVGPEATIAAGYSLEGEPVSAGAQISKKVSKETSEFVAEAFGKALMDLGKCNNKIVVLDADLAADCRTREFENNYPERFIQNGIAEQDMVSTAGGIAHHGLLPIVNSFASFLTSRANEQIYNNASEGTKIIYVNHYSGLIPAGPGKSHQSIRDISLMGALPNCLIVQPCNSLETSLLLKYCVEEAEETCLVRLIIGPSPRFIETPANNELKLGRGFCLNQGEDAIIFAYGPVMLHEALVAAEKLDFIGVRLKVINMPWLNRVDITWFLSEISNIKSVFFLEDHASVGGLGDFLTRKLIQEDQIKDRKIEVFGVEGYPACGTPLEVLRYHHLDGVSIASRIKKALQV